MKTCPNCGSKMEPSVNFCTNCGADLRNVPLDSDTQQPSAMKVNAVNMWQWFVNSWKNPFATQDAEKWYGWVTLLVENVLLVLGLYICINKYAQNEAGQSDAGQAVVGIISNFSTSVLFELFLYLVITAVAMIAIAYYAHKFVYGSTEPIFDFVNRIVNCSNISAILYVVSFICLIIGSEDMLKLGLPLVGLAMSIFSLAVYTVVVGDSAPAIHDKFYGLLIVVVVQCLVMFILGKIFGNAVYSQIQDLIHSSTNGMF